MWGTVRALTTFGDERNMADPKVQLKLASVYRTESHICVWTPMSYLKRSIVGISPLLWVTCLWRWFKSQHRDPPLAIVPHRVTSSQRNHRSQHQHQFSCYQLLSKAISWLTRPSYIALPPLRAFRLPITIPLLRNLLMRLARMPSWPCR